MCEETDIATLSDYLTDTRRLLHDANAVYWNDTDLTSFINRAMKQRDRDSGMNRTNISFTLTPGVAFYSLSVVASSGTVLFPVGGSTNAHDVGQIVLIYSNVRQLLDQQPYSYLTQLYQQVQGYQQVPCGFAKYGAGTVLIAPSPNQAYVTEWDMLVVANDLAINTDTDPLPYPWTDPVPFLAAHFAKLELQQPDEAAQYMNLYAQRLISAQAGSRGYAVPGAYGTLPPGWTR